MSDESSDVTNAVKFSGVKGGFVLTHDAWTLGNDRLHEMKVTDISGHSRTMVIGLAEG